MKKSFLLYVLFHLSWSFSQITFYQDICKCGVTGAGFSTGMGSGSGSFDIYIEPGSTIKKAYIFTYRMGYPTPSTFLLNGNSYVFDTSKVIMNVMHANIFASPIQLFYKDITQDITSANINFNLTISEQIGFPINWNYWSFFLYVIYENSSLPLTSKTIIINNKKLIGDEFYNINNLNPINTNFPVGFSLYTDRLATSNFDNTPNHLLTFNSTLLGTIGGSDNVNNSWGSAGVKGHFYYQNNQLFGLDDDTPDALMAGSDGLADVSSYLFDNSTSCNFQLTHINYPNQPANGTSVNLAYFLTYTSPCSAFPTQTSSDTTLCFGTTAQLFASGGGLDGTLPAYEWQPAVGLSCTDCPNPVVTADSSRLYTVRIRNNDSCSVVRPIKVNVKPLPEFSSVVSQPSICGGATGQILLGADYVGETYSINGGTPQTAGTFSNLAAGTYTVSLHELNGCNRDTLVVVGDTSLTQAYFTATPQSGAAPLWVQFSNQSTNANEFSWSVNGEPQGGNLSSFSFDTNGVYTVELVAWQFDPSCADTFSVLISVYDSLVVQIPNVFTPNHDGNNDFFGITVNRPCAISFSILNRWGNVIQSGTVPALGGFVPLWSGSNAPDGTYFYQIELQADDLKQVEKRQGFAELRE